MLVKDVSKIIPQGDLELMYCTSVSVTDEHRGLGQVARVMLRLKYRGSFKAFGSTLENKIFFYKTRGS